MPLPIILWGLGAAVAAYAGKKGYDYYSEEKEKEKRDRRARERQQYEEKVSKAKLASEAFESQWGERFESLLLVDSNIWMNRDYEDFFKNLEWVMSRFESSIKMSSVQFDEMINLKNLPYDNPKSKLARCALARIEYFQNIDLIEIIPMGLNAKKNAYADPDIIEILVDSLKLHSAMTLVSDDRELRIRANQILKDKQAPDFKSIMGTELHKEMKEYQENIQFLS
ncbi:DUF3824 domain-containing protein [Vibrio mangrovi]|uniref:DUF3824 domain-containing protein n=1 Tax=Vibrio mangrovi TaxID=474394 RepID=A0A1Y6IMY4_9VIBR|nr:DUF3824 domain-containing protein [Vibrio mangrovi]MDW6004179.1 DUF3824 domain-containing protein [Vibrio mangrovi]SMR99024.1 hypothetical protein VIM7927_00246 [Vibrio mangrovi]